MTTKTPVTEIAVGAKVRIPGTTMWRVVRAISSTGSEWTVVTATHTMTVTAGTWNGVFDTK